MCGNAGHNVRAHLRAPKAPVGQPDHQRCSVCQEPGHKSTTCLRRKEGDIIEVPAREAAKIVRRLRGAYAATQRSAPPRRFVEWLMVACYLRGLLEGSARGELKQGS